MKRSAHFAIGIAAAASVPAAVQAGANGNPACFVLGGVFGVLPGLLDDLAAACAGHPDMSIYPDPLRFDPRMAADGVALAVARAAETGRPIRLLLGRVRVSRKEWRAYEVVFDLAERLVRVSAGSIADDALLPCAVRVTDGIRVRVDASGDRLVVLVPEPDGRVRIQIGRAKSPWSHSLLVGLPAAACAAWMWGPWAGLIATAAWSLHIAADLVEGGVCSVWHPFGKARPVVRRPERPGLSPAAVWGAAVWVFGCLTHSLPVITPIHPFRLVFLGFAAPLAAWKLFLGRCTSISYGACRAAKRDRGGRRSSRQS